MLSPGRIRHGAFISDAFKLIGGTTAAKVIGLVLVPIVARLFTPEHFGAATLLLSYGVIFGNISALRYDQAIVLPATDAEAFRVFHLSVALILLVGAVSLAVTWTVSRVFADQAVIQHVGGWIYVVPAIIVLGGLNKVITSWCTRVSRYGHIGRADIVASLVTGGSRISIGAVSGSSTGALLVGALLGTLATGLSLFLGSGIPQHQRDSSTGRADLRELAYRYRDFPIYSVPTGFMRSFIMKMPIIMLGTFFSPAITGLYAMAARITTMPIEVISSSVRSIYMQRVARLRNNGKPITQALVKTTAALMLLGVVPFSLIKFYGPEIFSLVLGDKWLESGKYATILVPWLFSVFVVSPSTTNFAVLKRQSLLLKIQTLTGLTGAGVFAATYWLSESPEHALGWFVTLTTLANMVVFAIAFRITRAHDRAGRTGTA